jgi:hypothetical protein
MSERTVFALTLAIVCVGGAVALGPMLTLGGCLVYGWPAWPWC